VHVPITRLDQLVPSAAGEIPRVVVAAGDDPDVIRALASAADAGCARPILVADQARVDCILKELGLDPRLFQVHQESDSRTAAARAVSMVRSGEAHILMKGRIGTSDFMRAILHRERGLVPSGGLLSHVAVFQVPEYPRLLLIADAAIIPAPGVKEKIAIIENLLPVAHALGLDRPRVALLAAVEKVNSDMSATLDAAQIAQMAQRGQIEGVLVDGPLALDVAVSPECAEAKNLGGPVAGQADVLIVPDIEAGNVLYKSLTQLARAKVAAMVTGATAPIVLTSRADDDESKYLSLLLAGWVAQRRASKK
jgi:phosphate butyryltransferase